VLAGVDDLTARQQFGLENHPVEKVLAGRPPGAAILLSHSPWEAEVAAAAGAGLMLSGHTFINETVAIRAAILQNPGR
jgi:predicted MPP superfamily phosphohydrolase